MPDTGDRRLTRRDVLAGTAAGLAGAEALLRAEPWRAAPPPVPAPPVPGPPADRARHGAPDRGSDIATAVGREQEGRFGLMFPELEAFAPPDELLRDLAARMADPGHLGEAHPELDNPEMPSGYTYAGQFMVHDVTFDRTPLPEQREDPHALRNFDSARFDLDGIYAAPPEAYDQERPGRLRLPDAEGLPDLPREPGGTALLGDPRNDENLILAQLHLALIRFHNRLVEEGRTFAEAQRLTRWHWQYLVVNDVLERFVGRDAVERFLVARGPAGWGVKRRSYRPKNPNRPMMPLEYSLAAFRFGHSTVRFHYWMNASAGAPVFADVPGGEDLRGGRPIPASLRVDWRQFFSFPASPPPRNLARRIDTRLAAGLFSLPVPEVVAAVPAPPVVSLAERNLLRGKRLGLPAGQDVARALGVPPLSNEELGLTDAGWGGKAPLWYYILAEAERRRDGLRLGETGGRIVAEVVLGLLDSDRRSYFHARPAFLPAPPIAPEFGRFAMPDLLAFAGVA